MPIPSLQLQKKTCLRQRSRGFGHRVVVSKTCYNTVIVLSVVLCDCCKPMNNCWDWAFSNSGLEVWLPAFQLPMFAKCGALPKMDLFDMLVLRNPFPLFLLGIPSTHSLPEACSWERQYALNYGCIMPIPSLQPKEKPCLMQRSRVVTELWSPSFVTIQWLCSQSCYVTAANQWTIVEIELLATMGREWGCQPFSFLCLKNVTHSRNEIYATCLSKESIPAISLFFFTKTFNSWRDQRA